MLGSFNEKKMSWAYFPERFAQLKISDEIIARGFCLGFFDELAKVCMITLIKKTFGIFLKTRKNNFLYHQIIL